MRQPTALRRSSEVSKWLSMSDAIQSAISKVFAQHWPRRS